MRSDVVGLFVEWWGYNHNL